MKLMNGGIHSKLMNRGSQSGLLFFNLLAFIQTCTDFHVYFLFIHSVLHGLSCLFLFHSFSLARTVMFISFSFIQSCTDRHVYLPCLHSDLHGLSCSFTLPSFSLARTVMFIYLAFIQTCTDCHVHLLCLHSDLHRLSCSFTLPSFRLARTVLSGKNVRRQTRRAKIVSLDSIPWESRKVVLLVRQGTNAQIKTKRH